MAAMTPAIPNTYGKAAAPSVAGVDTTQDQWWNTGTGLIGDVNNAGSSGYTAADATAGQTTAVGTDAASYDPTSWNVTNPQTVQGQLANILDSGSPLSQRAETKALQGMNGRGLINSSMAVGAGQAALYDAALPIAQQDATTNAASARYNAEAGNASAQFNAGNQQQANLATSQAKNAANATNAQLTQQTNLANAAAENQAAQFGAAAENTAALQNAQAANSLQQQSNQIRQAAAAGDQSAQIDVSKMDLDQKFKVSLANADAQTKTFLQRMQGEAQTQLANIEADYRTLIETSASAREIYKGAIGQIGGIITNDQMTPDAKATALNGIYTNMANAMNIVGSINGVDLTDLLDFGTVTADAGAP